jgi:hypothetical protein
MKPKTMSTQARRGSTGLGCIVGGCLLAATTLAVNLPRDGHTAGLAASMTIAPPLVREPIGGVGTVELRPAAERGVMLLQVIGTLMLGLAKLAAGDNWKNLGATGVLISQVGLGLTGVLCAQFDSPFALFAGATLVALFLGTVWGSSSPAAEPLPFRIEPGPVA